MTTYTPYENSPFEKAKSLFIKRLSLFTAIVLGLLSIFYLFQKDIYFYPVLAGSLFAFITYLIVMRTNYVRLAAVFAIVSVDIIIVSKLFIQSPFHYLEDLFWIMCLAVFAFFVLGKLWGTLTLLLNILIVYVVFYCERHDFIALYQRPENPVDEINFAVNLIISVVIFTSILGEFLHQNNTARREYYTTHRRLEISNEEKSVMLKEIHHRVKNNLQIIISLLRLQSNEIKHSQEKEVFTESINRIRAIARVHDRMYGNEKLNRIDLRDYIEELILDLVRSYASRKDIKTTVTSDIRELDPNNIIPIALIINELVTNSIKHGFKGKTTGTISLTLKKRAGNELNMTYQDNGDWQEPAVNSSSIGMELIESFVEQLDGKMTIQMAEGTTFHFALFV